jgi:hypothetical protein
VGALGLLMAWFGYWVSFYGYDQLHGGNNSFSSLGVPGQFKNAPTDKAGGGSGNANAVANSAASVTSQSQQAAAAAALAAGEPGGSNPSGGQGIVQLGGGVTEVIGPQGQTTCLDAKGNIVNCPGASGGGSIPANAR